MRILSLVFVIILATFAVDAAYKSQKEGVRSVPDADYRHEGVFQPFLRADNIQTEKNPFFEGDFKFRTGHGHTDQRGTSELECPKACTMELKPVCGSDGRSYANRCELKATACKQRKRVYVEKEGRC